MCITAYVCMCDPMVLMLKEGAWKADFGSEHVDKTVTVETHPNLGIAMPTIHPCKSVCCVLLLFLIHRHDVAMKTMISLVLQSTQGQLDVK